MFDLKQHHQYMNFYSPFRLKLVLSYVCAQLTRTLRVKRFDARREKYSYIRSSIAKETWTEIVLTSVIHRFSRWVSSYNIIRVQVSLIGQLIKIWLNSERTDFHHNCLMMHTRHSRFCSSDLFAIWTFRLIFKYVVEEAGRYWKFVAWDGFYAASLTRMPWHYTTTRLSNPPFPVVSNFIQFLHK